MAEHGVADAVDDPAVGQGPVGVAAASQPKPRRRLPRRLRSWRFALAAVLLAAAAVGAYFLMSMQSPMGISAIAIEGVSPDLQPQVVAAIGAEVGEPFSSVDAAAATQRITAIEGVRGAKLGWSWFNTLTVTVAEKTPVGIVQSPTGQLVVVDAEGQSIRVVPQRLPGLPLIETGAADARRTALAVAPQIPEALRPQVDAVVVSSPNAVAVRMTSGATATLGTPTDLAKKFALVQQLLPTGAQQINVSVPERPALQGIPVPPAG